MVLLTSSSISVAVSSSIVGFFTFLLFLSGYVIQQQSVRNIQAALRPPTPTNSPTIQASISHPPETPTSTLNFNSDGRVAGQTPAAETLIAKPFGKPESEQTVLDTEEEPVDADIHTGQSQAYLQVLSKPSASEVCSAILLFDTLATNGTLPTDQIIVYPRSWNFRSPTRSLSAALELLKSLSKKHNIVIHTVDGAGIRDRSASEPRLFRKIAPKLSRYDRILFLRSPGLLLNTERLEYMFTSDTNSESDEIDEINQIWTPTSLSTKDRQLPPAFLVTNTDVDDQEDPSTGVAATSSYELNHASLRWTNYVVSSGSAPMPLPRTIDRYPAYVHFDTDTNPRKGRENVYYTNWKKGVQSACGGIGLNI